MNKLTPTKKVEVDVIIYAPLEAEYLGLQKFFRPSSQIDGNTFTGYFSEELDGKSIVVIVGFEWGNGPAQDVWREVLSKYVAKVAICTGIAGAVTKDAQLGYVYFASSITDLTQRAKLQEDNNGDVRTSYDPVGFECDQDILRRLNRRRLSIGEQSEYKKWQRGCSLRNSAKIAAAQVSQYESPGKSLSTPIATAGTIASVNTVIASTKALTDVKRSGRKVVCVDTESAGFIRELKRYPSVTPLVIRGISDFADEEKAVLENDYSELFREIAIANVASFLHHNFSALFENQAQQPELDLLDKSGSEILALELALNNNEETNRTELYERSILYKTTGAHDSLPVPRLKFKRSSQFVTDRDTKMEAEIETVLQEHSSVLAEVPNNYPDNALPWLYASVISRANLNDKLTIPIVVKWENFGPPKNSLESILKELNLLKLKNNSSYQIVFIFPNFLLGSASKSKFLKSEISKFKNASILVFSDRTEDTPYNNHLVEHLSPEVVSVQGISFSALTRYVNKFLEIELSEAEVLARRLLSTFDSHRLKMHPTYLASINKDTLTSFLEANQRGELVDITVAALLTLLVAGDESKVVLRRTAREDFLSELAVNIYAKKNNYTRSALEVHVQSLAERMGFAIKPKEFIATFENSGILNFENGHAQFTVPIIKSYMLAKGLLLDTRLAQQYFDFEDDEFDYSTFDLFCEYSRSLSILENLIDRLTSSINFFEKKLRNYDKVIENGKFNSRLLDKTLDLRKLSGEMSGKAQKLVNKTSLTSEKQAALDVQSQVSKTDTAKEVSAVDQEKFKYENLATRYYYISTVLLGAAAERLENAKKVDLVEKLLKLGSLMVTDLLTMRSQFDFDEAVNEVCERMIEEHNLSFKDDEDESDFKSYVEFIVADWDFRSAISPLLMFTNILCETGRTNVLLLPINEAAPQSPLQEFMRTSWAFDMDPKQERKRPKALSKMFGRDPFVRIAFASLFYYRSFWYHSKTENRQTIADGVEVILSKISVSKEMPEGEEGDPEG